MNQNPLSEKKNKSALADKLNPIGREQKKERAITKERFDSFC